MSEKSRRMSAAGLAFSVGVILIVALSAVFSSNGMLATILSEIALLVCTVAFALFYKLDMVDTFSLRMPSAPQVLLSALTALVLLPASLMLASIMLMAIEAIFGGIAIPAELAQQTNIFATLVFFCIMPAVCEEALFRGIVLSGLKSSFSPRAAIVVCGLLFGIFHMDIQRFIGQALLGVAIAFIVYSTRSIFCAMVVHFVNNAVALGAQSLSSNPAEALNIQNGLASINILDTFREQAAANGLSFGVMIAFVIFVYFAVASISIIVATLLLNKIHKISIARGDAPAQVSEGVVSRKSFLLFIPGLLIILVVYVVGAIALKNMF